jgi:hypothetical protein
MDPPVHIAGVSRTQRSTLSRVDRGMALPHDGHAPGGRAGGGVPEIAEVVAEMAAAIAYLEALSARLHVGDQPAGRDAAAIPPGTLVALRRSCERVARHADRALTAMSPRQAAAIRAAAMQLREIETLRFDGRTR